MATPVSITSLAAPSGDPPASPHRVRPPVDDLFAHGGRAGNILRGLDWNQKPVGPVDRWPQSLRTAVSLCLASRHPICIIWGPDRLYLYNDAYAPIVGAKHPWALGQSYITVWPEIWESSIRPILEAVERTGEASWCDNLLLVLQRRGFSEECYFSFSFAPVRLEDGTVGGVFTAITETTPQVVGERRLRTLRDLGPRVTAATSPEEACRLAAEVLGLNPHDVPFALFYLLDAGSAEARLIAQVGVPGASPACAATVRMDNSAEAIWPLSRAQAEHGPVVLMDLAERIGPLTCQPWPEPVHTAIILPVARPGEGEPFGFLVVGVSPRRAFDDGYRSFLELAARQVATAVAHAEAYAEERRRAEALAEIDRAKTAFFSNVSHEFRTPLTLMLGPLEDLLNGREPLPTGVRNSLALTHRNALRLLKLVNTLLDFSRIEAGRTQASYEPVDLGTLTAEIASVFRAAIEKAGLTYIVDCPPTSAPVFVDRDLWEKIVLNLVSNALKFTAAGTIELRLRQEGAVVRLSVRDTGVGIPEAEMPHLFQRFHRIENPRSRTHEGTGIGLALAQELAQLHGGDITARSQPGQGTTFTITLPTGHAHLPAERIGAPRTLAPTRLRADAFLEEALRWLPEADASRSEPAEAPEPGPDETPGGRILVVDDNADMRMYVRRLLEREFTVEAASDGEEALARVDAFRPQLVVTDIMMPRLDGFALLKALRARPDTRTLPVILVSARAGQEASVEGYDAGADDYLIKPFGARELLARVRTHLRLAAIRRQSVEALEAAGETQRRELERLVEQRTAELRRALDQMEEFSYSVSHDLRSPLRAMSGYAGIVLEDYRDSLDPAGRELLVRIQRNAERMDRLVRDLLTYSRIGRREVRLEPVALQPLVAEVIKDHSEMVPLRADIEIATPLPEVIAHEPSLTQAVANLLTNAVKFVAPGVRPKVVLRAERRGGMIRLWVEDNGIGIHPEHQPRLFGIFERIHGRHEYEGTGIGLAIVRKAIERMNGRVGLESDGTSGCRFWLELPAARAEENSANGTGGANTGARPG